MNKPITNAKGQKMFDLLRSAGIPVSGVVILGVFAHVECRCEGTARKVARLLSRGGFDFLKISHNTRCEPGYGGKVSHYWTAHMKAAA